jgi:hypothetical protein
MDVVVYEIVSNMYTYVVLNMYHLLDSNVNFLFANLGRAVVLLVALLSLKGK